MRRSGAATAIVASGDRDAFQLASEKTVILQPVRAGEMARIGPAEVRDRYGVDPGQVPDFIALRGDPSDKIPGAKGVGPKGAAALLQRYGSLDAALADGRFAAEADELRLYRRIATMNAAAPLPRLDDQTPRWAAAAVLARDWGLRQLADRLTALASAPPLDRPIGPAPSAAAANDRANASEVRGPLGDGWRRLGFGDFGGSGLEHAFANQALAHPLEQAQRLGEPLDWDRHGELRDRAKLAAGARRHRFQPLEFEPGHPVQDRNVFEAVTEIDRHRFRPSLR